MSGFIRCETEVEGLAKIVPAELKSAAVKDPGEGLFELPSRRLQERFETFAAADHGLVGAVDASSAEVFKFLRQLRPSFSGVSQQCVHFRGCRRVNGTLARPGH